MRKLMMIYDAAKILGIGDRASMFEIRSRFHTLMKEWHPDVSQADPSESHEMTIKLKEAYDILADYCLNYEISFRPDEIRQNIKKIPTEYWIDHFGDDPIWSNR
jgi:curved DNA-binding protein CbpA